MTHVRSFGTSTPVSNSRGELERILTRYGCTRHGTDMDSGRRLLSVWFTVPDTQGKDARLIPVRLEIDLKSVEERLKAMAGPRARKVATDWTQVERVAWRHIVLLVEAGLVAASAGVKPVSEFFLADTVIRDEGTGQSSRLIHLMESRDPEWKRLTAGSGAPA